MNGNMDLYNFHIKDKKGRTFLNKSIERKISYLANLLLIEKRK